MKLTVLMNNTSDNDIYISEHGLAFAIEYEGHKYLFDVGSTNNTFKNINALNINLESFIHLILSHGHYDHVNGIKGIRGFSKNLKIYHGNGFWNKKYSLNESELIYKGPSYEKEYLQSLGSVTKIDSPISEINPNTYLVTDFKRDKKYERIDPKFKVVNDNNLTSDLFNDEIVLCLKTTKGLVVIVGCAHPGIVNIVTSIKEYFKADIHAVIGGFHLNHLEETYIEDVVDKLAEQVHMVIPLHCSGDKAQVLFQTRFGNRYKAISLGQSIQID